jgi:hypothetical protein
MVCKVPIESMGFRHVGEAYLLKATAKGLSWDMLVNPVKGLADHAPVNYLLRLPVA